MEQEGSQELTPMVTKFEKGRNRGTRVCGNCGKRTWESRWSDQAGFCSECYELMGRINAARDGNRNAEADKLEAELYAKAGTKGTPGELVP